MVRHLGPKLKAGLQRLDRVSNRGHAPVEHLLECSLLVGRVIGHAFFGDGIESSAEEVGMHVDQTRQNCFSGRINYGSSPRSVDRGRGNLTEPSTLDENEDRLER